VLRFFKYLAIAAFFAWLGTAVVFVDQSEFALLTRFGEVVGDGLHSAGLDQGPARRDRAQQPLTAPGHRPQPSTGTPRIRAASAGVSWPGVRPSARRSGAPARGAAVGVWVSVKVVGAAASALATGRMPRLAATVLAASMVPTTLAGHAFWKAETPEERKRQILQFAKNVSVTGGLVLAAVDTEAKPGLAWRARDAGRKARREAKHLARDARREARLAKATHL